MATHAPTLDGDPTPIPKRGPMPKLRVSHFRKSLRANPDAIRELPDASMRRYSAGDFPHVVNWLLRFPDLLKALALDARELTPEERALLDDEARDRERRFKEGRKGKEE
jgi:hypothetical protein